MDKNLMTCPKCSHSVSDAAGVCAYCGAPISEGEPIRQIDEEILREETQSPETLPPPLPEESPTAVEFSEIQADIQAVTGENSAPQHPPFFDPTPAGDLIQKLKTPEIETELKSDLASPEEENLISTVNGQEKSQVSPESDLMELTVDEPANAKTPEAEILEIAGVDTPPAIETTIPPDKSAPETQNTHVQEVSPVNGDDTTIELRAEVKPEASEEEILLTLDAEVQSVVKDLPESVAETKQMESKGDLSETTGAAGGAKAPGDSPHAPDESQSDAEAIQKQFDSQAMDEILRIEKAAQDMEAALKKQRAAMTQTPSMKKEKPIPGKLEEDKQKKAALAKTQALKSQIKAEDAIESSKKVKSAASILKTKDAYRKIVQGLKVRTTMMSLLKKYEGQSIGINYDNSAEIKKARLVAANDEFFSVFVEDNELQYSYPLKTILTVIEGKDGVGAGVPEKKSKFNAVIKVYPLVHL